MEQYLPRVIIVALVGAGVISGLLFAFSNFIMRALSELPNEYGMVAMQRVNDKIINPIFAVLFFGTPLACAIIIAVTIRSMNVDGYLALFLGALAYLVGPLGITMLRNVPLNNKLARTPRENAESEWPAYQRRWQFWNHIRCYAGVLATFLLALGLRNLA